MRKVTPVNDAPKDVQKDARALALHLLLEVVRHRQSLDRLLPQLYDAPLSAPDKGFARQLLMLTLRHHGQLAALVDAHVQTPMEPKLQPVHWLMRMGVVQLLLLKTPPHAALNTSVTLCKTLGFVHQAGMVNAVLRKIAAAQPELPPATYNLPSWLKGAWRKAYGREATDAMAEQFLTEPPLDLQWRAAPPESLCEAFENAGCFLPNATRVPNQDIRQIEGYEEGAFWVQDMAASLPVRVLGDVAGKQVLDLCAAPGGKTMQLCALGAQVIAVDRSAARLARVQQNLQRLGFAAQQVQADLTQWRPECDFDAVLLDAPCSATGTARRHPDLMLRKQQTDVQEMVALQRAILVNIMQWLPANVPLVYCVCSLQPEEGEAQMQWLLEQYDNMRLLPIAQPDWPASWSQPDGTLRTLPHGHTQIGGIDGFFIAKLCRNG